MKTLRSYLDSLPFSEQQAFAARCDTSIGYLRKALCVTPRMDGALVRKLWEQSDGAVSRTELRPDIWPPENTAQQETA